MIKSCVYFCCASGFLLLHFGVSVVALRGFCWCISGFLLLHFDVSVIALRGFCCCTSMLLLFRGFPLMVGVFPRFLFVTLHWFLSWFMTFEQTTIAFINYMMVSLISIDKCSLLQMSLWKYLYGSFQYNPYGKSIPLHLFR